jgi:prepilin-type N-terminal cleavage/methylation domain-containing protein
MLTNKRGFSLVEILVVMAIFGVVATVILDLYVNVQRSTISSEEVVEVQQGMRLALDQMSGDIQMAGFLVPTNIPITVAQNDLITIATATAFNSVARIEQTAPPTSFPAGSTAQTINVSNGAMAQLFSVGAFVRIIQPATGGQLGGVFTVTGVNPSSLRLEPLVSPAADINFVDGDLIVQVPSPADDATYPNQVTYLLEDDPASADPLMRVLSRLPRAGIAPLTLANRDTSERIIATNITALRFEYLMDDGTVAPAPTAALGTAVDDSRLGNIVGVRIYLTGLTEEAKTRGSKTRELQTTVKIRNKL